jgi:4-hydroxy-tetrahydrodipicolinate reductase
MASMRLGIAGCGGRMGRMLVQTALATEGVRLAGGCERPDHPAVGQDIGTLAGLAATGLVVTSDAARLFPTCDAVIDFTSVEAVGAHAELAARHQAALVVGTTGLKPAHLALLAEAARMVPVVQSANMSVGVNLLLGLTRQVAAVLGEDYDIEIVEMHHRHKIDAPSGTALALGEAAAAGRKVSLEATAVRVRDGITGPRPKGAIGFASLRGGDVVGEHSVIFAADGERIELTHKASARQVFAKGAVRAALWSAGRPPGFYTMRDVLGLT